MDRSECLGILEESGRILSKEGVLNQKNNEEYQRLFHQLQSFRPKVLLAGQFSAGKSALLNAFLGGEEILPENISPETAIATELHYGAKEMVIRVHKDGTEESVSRADIRNLSTGDCEKYIYVLPNEKLAQLKEITLVDMPGFDSGIDAHNRALLQYAHEAAAYVYVSDITRGTLSSSESNFLMELADEVKDIRFVLTKSDELTDSKKKEVLEEYSSVLDGILGKEVPITVTSKYDSEVQKKLVELFNSFVSDRLVLKKMGPSLSMFLWQGQSLLTVKRDALSFDGHEFEQAIQDREQALRDFRREFAMKRNELHTRMATEYVPRILNDIDVALHEQSGKLTRVALTGDKDAFRLCLSGILRPVLKESCQDNLEEQLGKFGAVILENMPEEKALDAGELADKTMTTVVAVEKAASIGMKFAKAHEYKRLYTMLASTLAITTNVIYPWLEVIIAFLPDILSALQNIFGESNEEKVEHTIEDVFIPKIVEKFRPELEKTANALENNFAGKLEQQYTDKINQGKTELNNLQREMKGEQTNIQNQKQQLTDEIQELQKNAELIDKAIAAL